MHTASSPVPESAPKLPRRGDRPWVRRALVFLACVLLLDGLFGDRGLARTMRARKEAARATDDLQRLREQNAALRQEVRRLQGDAATIEMLARQELGLIRPGEILVVVKDVK